MSEASEYVKEELRKLSIQVAVLGERMDARFEQIDARIDGVQDLMTAGFREMKQIIAGNHAALISAVMKR